VIGTTTGAFPDSTDDGSDGLRPGETAGLSWLHLSHPASHLARRARGDHRLGASVGGAISAAPASRAARTAASTSSTSGRWGEPAPRARRPRVGREQSPPGCEAREYTAPRILDGSTVIRSNSDCMPIRHPPHRCGPHVTARQPRPIDPKRSPGTRCREFRVAGLTTPRKCWDGVRHRMGVGWGPSDRRHVANRGRVVRRRGRGL
jgi:hypothetical protein